MISRRDTLKGAAAFSVATGVGGAFAADPYPSRPITIVVPYPPGGTVGAMARLLAERVGTAIKGKFVVENKGGAAGSVGTLSVARAAPDGYTLVLGTQQTHATNVFLVKNLQYDPVKDFVPIAQVSALQHLLVTRKDLGPKNLKEFVELARSKADGLIYGSTGVGSAAHFITELFRTQARIPTLVHVPFRGAAPLAQELLGGRVDFAMASVASILGQVESGLVIALGTASDTRSPNFKDLPTFKEMGVDVGSADAWFTLFAPTGTPKEIVTLLETEIQRQLSKDDVKRTAIELGLIPDFKAGSEVATALPAEIQRWAAIAKSANMIAE